MSEVVNTSGLRPRGACVLLEPYEPEFKRSLIAIPDTVSDRSKMLETRAVVVEIGPNAWQDEPPRAKVGDKVMISKFAGTLVYGPKDGKSYRAVNANDIYMQVED
jgi:co-chaperonin GroES (HSP10)